MLDKKVAARLVLAFILGIIGAGFLLICTTLAQGATTKQRPNSLGIEQFYMNPNTYMFGRIIGGGVAEKATSVRFQPYDTMVLYEESVLFCGDVAEQFNGKTAPVVVTYARVAHRLYRGVACHDLVSVFEVHDDQTTVKP